MDEKKIILIDCNTLYNFIYNVLINKNVNDDIAHYTTDAIWQTSLRGVDSHGIRLLPHYAAAVSSGRINSQPNITFLQKGLSVGILDADHTFGHAAGFLAMDYAIQMAEKTGVGMVAVKNSSHCGALAPYAFKAIEKDMLGLAFTHASPKVRTPGSNRPFFGTNPMCFVAPMLNEAPLCYDSAPTYITSNKMKQYRENDIALPENCAADKDGFITQNPHIAEQLLPIADYKGFGLTLMVDVLCSLLSTMPVGDEISSMYGDPLSEKRYLGQFYGAISIQHFEDINVFKRRMQKMVDKIRNEPLFNNNKIQVPGDPEKTLEKERRERGIPVPEIDLIKLNKLASECGLERLS